MMKAAGTSAVLGTLFALALAGAACTRTEAPAVPDAPPAPPPPAPAGPATPIVDAGPDIRDAGTEAAAPPSGPARRGGRKRAAAAPEPAGSGGTLSALQAAGELPQAEVSGLIRGRTGALRGCYEEERAKRPALKGKVDFKLTIDRRGRVSLAEITTSTLDGGDAEMCMVQALRTLKFPAAPAGGESTATFRMSF